MSLSNDEVLMRRDELRRFVLEDLDRMLAMPIGGNFAVARVIAAGCEALASLRGERKNQGWKVAAEILPDPDSDVAESLWKAMRNGLLHSYWPNTLHVDGTDIALSSSWRERAHLSWSSEGELVLLVPALVEGLRDVWASFSAQLELDTEAQKTAQADLEELDRIDTIKDPEKQAWLRILETHRP